MGCLCSTSLSEENSLRTFNVVNVDDLGQERNPGSIEISDSELVWYQRGKEPIRWPLKSLRRYGFDAELFSFESGRRCPTGPGIYAFKCRRAEALFNLLQESIQRQRTGQEEGSGPPPSSAPGSQHTQALPRSNPTASDRIVEVPRSSRPNSLEVSASPVIPRGNASPPLYINSDIRQANRHEYMNTDVPPSDGRTGIVDSSAVSVIVPPAAAGTQDLVVYADLDLPKQEDSATAESTPAHVPNGHGPPRRGDTVQLATSSQQVMYVNIPANEIKSKIPNLVNGNGKSPLATGAMGNGLPRHHLREDGSQASGASAAPNGSKMNYVQIDHGERDAAASGLNQAPHFSANILSAPESPTRTKTGTYARIDIERTQALNNHRRCSIEDEGPRKTRHDSNIEDRCA